MFMPSPSRPEESPGSPETRVTESCQHVGPQDEQVLLTSEPFLPPTSTPFEAVFVPLNSNTVLTEAWKCLASYKDPIKQEIKHRLFYDLLNLCKLTRLLQWNMTQISSTILYVTLILVFPV